MRFHAFSAARMYRVFASSVPVQPGATNAPSELMPLGIERLTACLARVRGILPIKADHATTQNDLTPARALKELRRW